MQAITPAGRVIRTAARGEAVDFDKYDKEGRPNPYHGWTLDFPEYVPPSDRTYSNKERAQGWYDDPENEPLAPGTRWGGTGDYADKHFYTHTQQYSQQTDPNREEVIDPSGALGQYGVGEEDLNEYYPQGHNLHPQNQVGYPEGFNDSSRTHSRGVYSDRPDLNPWPGMEQDLPTRSDAQDHSDSGRVFGMWHGGHSYSHGDPTQDMESFPSLEHARRAVEGRYGNYNSHHEGERTTYNQETGTHHLTGNTHDSNMETPAVDRTSGMDIYHAQPSINGGWHVDTDNEPAHHIWINADGNAVVGRERGDYGPEYDHEDNGTGEYSDDLYPDYEEDEGSHPLQEHLTRDGFEHHPDEHNGDRYIREDSNGNTHTVRAPNPRYGSHAWHYEFSPEDEGDRDPYAPDPSRDGPQSLSFSARNSEEAHNLHNNIGEDLSDLASGGWGIHAIHLGPGPGGEPGNARQDNSYLDPGSNHTIEAHRRDANDSGYDRVFRNANGTWGAHHVSDGTPNDRYPRVTSIAQGRSRRDVLDQADRHDAHTYLTSRAADRGNYYQHPEPEGGTTWIIPHVGHPGESFTIHSPSGEGRFRQQWFIKHDRDTEPDAETVTSHPTWLGARSELMGRI